MIFVKKVFSLKIAETVSRISNAYSLRRGRRQPPTAEVEELQFIIVIVM
jgi:hypothetical protein